ncbi:MAG: RodZ domain-containing protein [Betaproteobacteria bacterium]
MNDNNAASNLTAGAALLAERRRQSLSLGDVSRQLKLAVRQVEALERDDYSGFRPVFVHGFIRNYAKLLGLDPEPLIRAADSMLSPPPAAAVDTEGPQRVPLAEQPARKSNVASVRRWGIVAIVVFVGVALVLALGGRRERDTTRGGEVVASRDKAAEPKALTKPVEADSPVSKSAEVEAAPARPAEPASVGSKPAENQLVDVPSGAKPKTAESKPLPKAATAAASEASPRPSDAAGGAVSVEKIRVRMIFDREAWVEIKDRNGATIFGQLNAAGTRRSVSGEPPLSVVVGNASGVQLFMGEKSIDLAPHTRADIDLARLKLE